MQLHIYFVRLNGMAFQQYKNSKFGMDIAATNVVCTFSVSLNSSRYYHIALRIHLSFCFFLIEGSSITQT